MTWERFAAARLFLAEERVGQRVRKQLAEEDEGVNASIAALRQDQR